MMQFEKRNFCPEKRPELIECTFKQRYYMNGSRIRASEVRRVRCLFGSFSLLFRPGGALFRDGGNHLVTGWAGKNMHELPNPMVFHRKC